MITVEIPIKDPKTPPRLKFPDRCVHCGKPSARSFPVKLNTGAQKRGQSVQLEMEVRLCATCMEKEHRIGNVTWIPFSIAGLLGFVVVFIRVWRITPEGPTLQTLELPYVLGAFVGMIAGILIGTLVELGLKVLFVPVHGSMLLKRPLTVLSVFSDSEDFIGVSIGFANQKKILNLSFENDDVAREFIALNSKET